MSSTSRPARSSAARSEPGDHPTTWYGGNVGERESVQLRPSREEGRAGAAVQEAALVGHVHVYDAAGLKQAVHLSEQGRRGVHVLQHARQEHESEARVPIPPFHRSDVDLDSELPGAHLGELPGRLDAASLATRATSRPRATRRARTRCRASARDLRAARTPGSVKRSPGPGPPGPHGGEVLVRVAVIGMAAGRSHRVGEQEATAAAADDTALHASSPEVRFTAAPAGHPRAVGSAGGTGHGTHQSWRRRNTSSVSSVHRACPWLRARESCSAIRRSTAAGGQVGLHPRVGGAERAADVVRADPRETNGPAGRRSPSSAGSGSRPARGPSRRPSARA